MISRVERDLRALVWSPFCKFDRIACRCGGCVFAFAIGRQTDALLDFARPDELTPHLLHRCEMRGLVRRRLVGQTPAPMSVQFGRWSLLLATRAKNRASRQFERLIGPKASNDGAQLRTQTGRNGIVAQIHRAPQKSIPLLKKPWQRPPGDAR
ncbi:hypothetical protein [Mesorhizobium sp. B2-3-5]|uniref:hypothetical protein n=1 Tax=Mesorhizobium sp. B2-3-5 TaxID=2589958 RepID=UPI0015E28E7A|nr:hypothetical protein [Mesorhizobium sp. B2-3-5]